ncbi:hypothetical protein ACSVIJ_18435 [Pseudomonas sp. NCHU5208]|uniref:hypothetical protein n=1 Tax=unclassified Pseudomonas TaxID=196821 RepID=UPI003F9CA11C
MKKQNLLFILTFFVIALVAITFFGVSDVLGIILTSCIGGLMSSLITGRRKVYDWEAFGNLKVVLLPSTISAAIMAVLLAAKFYILTMAVGITGSPYEVYQINFFRVVLITWSLSFVSLALTLMAHDKLGGDRS